MKLLKNNKSIFFLFVIVFLIAGINNLHAQFVQIESILIDACDGTVEGKNEMVSFRVESLPINVADIRVDGSINGGAFQTSKWPNTSNSFLGWITPSTAAYSDAVSKVNQINASIVNCGKLIIPTGGTNNQGVIPAGKKGLIITSTDFSPFANDFSTLTDTFYVIFQKPGNTSGHFANYSAGSGMRALRLHKISTNVNESVAYDKALLIDQSAIHIAQDGAGVKFTDSGVATYYNDGCQAPYTPLNPNWTAPAQICPTSPSINLNSLVVGTPGGTWSGTGVSGSSFNPSGLNGTYTVIYTVGIPPCELTQSHNIVVVPSSIATWIAPSTVCQSSSAINLNTLLATNASTGGTWSGSGVSGSIFNPSVLNGNVTVTYTVGISPCVATESHTINVVSSTNASWTAPAPICQSSPAINLNTFLSSSSTLGGVWSGNGVTGDQFSPAGLSGNISITYSVGTIPCNSFETHQIQVLPSANASWTPPVSICQSSPALNLNTLLGTTSTSGGVWSGNGVSGNMFNPSSQNGDISITYTVGISPCIASESHTIQVIQNANASWTAPVSICENSPTVDLNSLLTLGSTNGGTWSGSGVVGNVFNPQGLSANVAITYSVGVSPCNASESHTIQILPSSNANWNSPVSVCDDASIDLTPFITGDAGGIWSGQGMSQSVFNPQGLIGSISITYVVGGANSCSDTVTHFISVTMVPDASWIAPQIICKNDNTFDLNTLITGTPDGTWSGDDINSNILDLDLMGDSVLATYTVNTNNCISSVSAMLYFSEVIADFTLFPSSGIAPLNVTTQNLSVNAVIYKWNFGNGFFSDETNPETAYVSEGTYYVWLMAVSNDGCRDSIFKIVTVDESPVFIPNVFTPNNDGKNDYFYPEIYSTVQNYHLMIFNRWGEIIFESKTQTDKWDGKFNGKQVAEGVYYYVLKYRNSITDNVKKGTVTVVY